MIDRKTQNNSELLKAIAHPVRLCIIRKLIENSCNVSEMHTCLKRPQSTISRHLSRLRQTGIIKGKREGTQICYKLIHKKVEEVIQILFS